MFSERLIAFAFCALLFTTTAWAKPRTEILIYDGSFSFFPIQVIKNGTAAGFGHAYNFTAAHEAYQNFSRVVEFYQRHFSRESYDDHGAPIIVTVNAPRRFRGNAAWSSSKNEFVFGASNEEFGNFPSALDVVAHEFTHAVIGSSSQLERTGQSGAVAEHVADILGEIVRHEYEPTAPDFIFGDRCLAPSTENSGRGLRNLLHPSQSLSPQPEHIEELPLRFGPGCRPSSSNDQCGVHVISGILNRAGALAIQAVGREKIGNLYYQTIIHRLDSHSDFYDFKDELLNECALQLKTNECNQIKAAFLSVGIDDDYTYRF